VQSHELFQASQSGDRAARDQLFAAFYEDLRSIARRELNRSAGAAVSATTLVHEFYSGLADREGLRFPDRARFLAYASRAMRGFIIDAARDRHALKRGGAFHITHLDTGHADAAVSDHADLQRVSDALDDLEKIDAKLAEVVDLKYFCGFSFAEIAAMHGLSERTVQRNWEKARLWLFDSLKGADF